MTDTANATTYQCGKHGYYSGEPGEPCPSCAVEAARRLEGEGEVVVGEVNLYVGEDEDAGRFIGGTTFDFRDGVKLDDGWNTLALIHRTPDSEGQTMTGAQRIARERRRQVEEEGWDDDHDHEHQDCELALAALCYIGGHIERHHTGDEPDLPGDWPWSRVWWKPKDPLRDLVRAGALIAAEIDRLLRHAPDSTDPGDE